MKKKFIRPLTVITFLTTSAVYFTVPLHAAEYKENAAEVSSFSQLDTNRNGFIEREEAARLPSLLQTWPQIDANKDGKLSVEEFSALPPAK